MTSTTPYHAIPVAEHADDGPEGHDLGLAHDFPLLRRRRLLGLVGGTTVAALSTFGVGTAAQAAALQIIPTETAGPYPGDGSTGVDVLTSSGIVRGDIRRSFGKATGVARGVPLTLNLTLVHASTGRAAPGLAVYLWQCDREARYSLYSPGLTGENYLRGVQAADHGGRVTFRSIFPACYAGRWPHLHVEVHPSLAQAGSSRHQPHTSQLALPAEIATEVYASSAYTSSRANFARTSLATDHVFRDGYPAELPAFSGSVAAGFSAALTVGV